MKIQILTLAITTLAAVANAADTTTSSEKIKPTAVIPNPPGLVCPMTVCPSVSASLAKRDLACPATCPNDCEVVDDHCCPGNKKAVCKAGATVSGSVSVSGSATGIPSASSAVITPAPSSSASASVSPAAASSSSKPSAATVNTASVLSTFMLAALLTVGLNQL
ncbi:unnamed protein product [Mucor hiemalis]